jgi:hypothetical protein
MVEHPLYAMWKDRRAAELAAETERRRRAVARHEGQREWRESWETYQRHWADGRAKGRRRPWWHRFRAWLLTWPRLGDLLAKGRRGDGQGTPSLDV